MRSNIHGDLFLLASKICVTPDVQHPVAAFGIKLRDLLVIGGHLDRVVQRVEQSHHRAIRRCARPILSRERGIVSPIWVDTPLVRRSRLSIDWILIERQQRLVLQNADVVIAEFCHVRTDQQGRLHHSPEREVRADFFVCEDAVADFEHICIIVAVEVAVVG
jgi:hypothetical protein